MVSAITVEDLEQHIKELYSNVQMVMLVTGNMYKDVSFIVITIPERRN